MKPVSNLGQDFDCSFNLPLPISTVDPHVVRHKLHVIGDAQMSMFFFFFFLACTHFSVLLRLTKPFPSIHDTYEKLCKEFFSPQNVIVITSDYEDKMCFIFTQNFS